MEDKLLQTAVREVPAPIYEPCFYPCSYGYRPGKSPHQALQALFQEVSVKGKRTIIDADVSNYFGNIDHGKLRKMPRLRIKDGVIRRMIDKWLKARILEDGQLSYPEAGRPQAGSFPHCWPIFTCMMRWMSGLPSKFSPCCTERVP